MLCVNYLFFSFFGRIYFSSSALHYKIQKEFLPSHRGRKDPQLSGDQLF